MWHTCQHPWSSSSLGIEQHSPLFGISLLAPCLHPGEMELQISWRIDILVALRQPCLGKSHHAAVPEVSLEPNVPWSKKTQKNKLRTPSCHSLLCDGHPIMWPQWLYGVTWLSGFLCFLFVIVGCEGTVVCVVIVQIKLKCKLRLQKSSFCFSEQLRASGAFTTPSPSRRLHGALSRLHENKPSFSLLKEQTQSKEDVHFDYNRNIFTQNSWSDTSRVKTNEAESSLCSDPAVISSICITSALLHCCSEVSATYLMCPYLGSLTRTSAVRVRGHQHLVITWQGQQ